MQFLCCVMFSGVQLSMGSFVLFIKIPSGREYKLVVLVQTSHPTYIISDLI